MESRCWEDGSPKNKFTSESQCAYTCLCICVFVGVTHSLFNVQLLLGYYYCDDYYDYYSY